MRMGLFVSPPFVKSESKLSIFDICYAYSFLSKFAFNEITAVKVTSVKKSLHAKSQAKSFQIASFLILAQQFLKQTTSATQPSNFNNPPLIPHE